MNFSGYVMRATSKLFKPMNIFELVEAGDFNRAQSLIYISPGLLYSRDEYRCTLLHIAALNGNIEMFKFLLKDLKDYVNTPCREGVVPLHIAAFNGHLAIVRTLLKHGADKDFKDDMDLTALDYAEMGGHIEIIEELEK